MVTEHPSSPQKAPPTLSRFTVDQGQGQRDGPGKTPTSPLSPPVSGPLCTSRVGGMQMQVPPRRIGCFTWAGCPGHTPWRRRAETLSRGGRVSRRGFRSCCVQHRPPLPPACVLSRVSHLPSHKERLLVGLRLVFRAALEARLQGFWAPPVELALASGSALPAPWEGAGPGPALPPSLCGDMYKVRGQRPSKFSVSVRDGSLGRAGAGQRRGRGPPASNADMCRLHHLSGRTMASLGQRL